MTGTTIDDNDAWLAALFAQCPDVADAPPVVAQDVAAQVARRACTRCGGRGYISQFSHNKGGECFACHGSGSK